MNKIYKVIWSKTRNCYVAVAEFVKRNGKGGSVLNRRHIAAALAAVAICAAPAGAQANTGGHWDGNDYIGDAPYNVTINEDVNGIAYGRYETDANAGASGATLSIVTGGKANAAFGGRAASGDVTGNKVTMTDGETVVRNVIWIGDLNVSGMLIGGFADTGNVEKNTVELSGGTVNSWLIGGYAEKGEAKENSVTISGGTIGQIVCGGYSGGTATGNTVTIKGGTTNSVVGGYSSGDAVANKVIISGGTVKEGVCGGQVLSPHSKGNTVANKVIISGGSIENDAKVYGGRSESNSGNATDNMVTIGEKFEGAVGQLYGGYSNNGSATDNRVEIAGGSLGGAYGGFSEKGSAAGNQVDITGGTFGGVFGGFSDSGDATGNRVKITGSKVGAVFGGFSNKVVKYNTVIIGGGTFEEGVYGGFSQPGVAEKNAVTISDGTFENPIQVFGGYSQTKATDNAVNLTGTTTGLDMAELQGYPGGADFNVSHSGNELHIGGTKTYDKNGTATITKGSWQGMDASGKHTNTVAKAANFDSIVLHNVVWGDVPAISAKEIKNIGGLDVTGLEFYTHPDNSTVHEHALKDYMVLVHSDEDDLTGLKISYLDEGNVKTEALTNQGIHYHTAPHSSTENGVTVDGKEVKRIFLADHNKSVDFFYHVTGDKITLGEVNFIKGGTARILDGRFDVRNAVIDTFKDGAQR